MQASRVSGAGGHNYALVHHTLALKSLGQPGDTGIFLTNGDIYIDNIRLLFGLINHGINGDGRFTGLAVTDNQLPLATANRYHGVNGRDTAQERFMDTFAINDTRRWIFYGAHSFGFNSTFAI